jgi:hypothetical protein
MAASARLAYPPTPSQGLATLTVHWRVDPNLSTTFKNPCRIAIALVRNPSATPAPFQKSSIVKRF